MLLRIYQIARPGREIFAGRHFLCRAGDIGAARLGERDARKLRAILGRGIACRELWAPKQGKSNATCAALCAAR